MNESSLLWFNYPLPMNGERDAYGDRKLSQRGPGWGWSWFLSFSDTFHRGSSASPSGSLTGTGLSPESRLQRCWARLIFFFFFNLFRVKPRRASGEAQPVELDKLNYH